MKNKNTFGPRLLSHNLHILNHKQYPTFTLMKKLLVLLALVAGVTTTSFASTTARPTAPSAVAQPAAEKVIKVATKEEMVALASKLTANTNAKVVAEVTDVIIIVFDDGTVIIIIVGN